MTERLIPNEIGIQRAATLLAAGDLVAFPTETVYGLGADARSDRAVAKVYDAKGRPSFNPLIVHVTGGLSAVAQFAQLSSEVESLIGARWPKGLTLVLPLKPDAGLSPLVTAGLDTIAIRIPDAPVATALLEAFGGPVAAPSANPSGRISPTTADHVLSGLDGRIAAVLDGGATPQGLESTILGFPGPVVLREGAYPVAEDMARAGADATLTAPGQLASHYAPDGTLRLNAETAAEGEFFIGFGEIDGDLTLSRSGDLVEAAAKLFAALHAANAAKADRIAVAPIPDHGLGRAINDRLRRAAAPRG